MGYLLVHSIRLIQNAKPKTKAHREREEMDDRILERERHQMEQIRELDLEELQVEEVDGLHDSSDDDLCAM